MIRNREKTGTDSLAQNKTDQVLKINPSFFLHEATSKKIVPSPESSRLKINSKPSSKNRV